MKRLRNLASNYARTLQRRMQWLWRLFGLEPRPTSSRPEQDHDIDSDAAAELEVYLQTFCHHAPTWPRKPIKEKS